MLQTDSQRQNWVAQDIQKNKIYETRNGDLDSINQIGKPLRRQVDGIIKKAEKTDYGQHIARKKENHMFKSGQINAETLG